MKNILSEFLTRHIPLATMEQIEIPSAKYWCQTINQGPIMDLFLHEKIAQPGAVAERFFPVSIDLKQYFLLTIDSFQ